MLITKGDVRGDVVTLWRFCIDAPQSIATKSLHMTALPFLYSMVASVADSLQTISQSGGKILLLVNKFNQSVITMLRAFWIKKIN